MNSVSKQWWAAEPGTGQVEKSILKSTRRAGQWFLLHTPPMGRHIGARGHHGLDLAEVAEGWAVPPHCKLLVLVPTLWTHWLIIVMF